MHRMKFPVKQFFWKISKTACLVFLLFILFLFSLIAYLQFSEEKATFNKKEAKAISYTPLVQLVPGDKIPSDLKIFKSNNNLDLVKFKGRYYKATPPTQELSG